MPDYDFSTLSDRDLEELVKDLLNSKYGWELQSFKRGRDGGVDLRYATATNENHLVVQVKHYAVSGYNKLYHSLKTEELPKVQQLQPHHYIIATSVGLSGKEVSNIQQLFTALGTPQVTVLGKHDLNTLLGQYPDVEKNHYKLWLSSTTMLEAMYNNAALGRSAYLVAKGMEYLQMINVMSDERKLAELNFEATYKVSGQTEKAAFFPKVNVVSDRKPVWGSVTDSFVDSARRDRMKEFGGQQLLP